MSNYIVTDTELTAVADAIRTKGGTAALIPWQAGTGFADAVGAIPSGGGAELQNGVAFNTLDSTGKPTAVTYYGEVLNTWQFNGNMYGGMWKPLISVTCKGVKKVGEEAFAGLTNLETISGLFSEGLILLSANCFKGAHLPQSITLPQSLQSVQGQNCFNSATGIEHVVDLHTYQLSSYFFQNCKSLKSYRGERIRQFWGQRQFYNCTALESVQIGSVGYGVYDIQYNDTFSGCTNNDLVITYFAKGDYVDRLVSYTRNGATNATIIIKASEATTYNGTSYAAGDTILTSEVTS